MRMYIVGRSTCSLSITSLIRLGMLCDSMDSVRHSRIATSAQGVSYKLASKVKQLTEELVRKPT